MSVRPQQRWPSGLMLVFGAWLFCSPYWIGSYDAGGAVVWACQAAGTPLVVLGAFALLRPRPWQAWGALSIAGWLLIAPFVLQWYRDVGAATLNHIVVGVLVGLDAVGLLATRQWRGRVGSSQPELH